MNYLLQYCLIDWMFAGFPIITMHFQFTKNMDRRAPAAPVWQAWVL